MTIEEAKELYFQFDGHFFHMDREEPAKANALRMLELGPEIYRAWDEEMLRQYFDRLWADENRVWSVHSRILAILGRGKCDLAYWCAELLRQMDKMTGLDLFNKTLIVENMAGRTVTGKDGGVYIYCVRLKMAGALPETAPGTAAGAMAKAMDKTVTAIIHSVDDTNDERFLRAVSGYQASYDRWKE